MRRGFRRLIGGDEHRGVGVIEGMQATVIDFQKQAYGSEVWSGDADEEVVVRTVDGKLFKITATRLE